MKLDVPEWLARRGGEIVRGVNEGNWLVLLDGKPQYRVDLKPARGAFTYAIKQTVNGREVAGGRVFPTLEDALRGGLDHLRESLGW